MAWVIDERHSYVGFAIKHMMFTTVRGRFRRYRASIDIQPDNLTASRFCGEIDVASIDTYEARRDEHLRSADFFDVARYPTITYESTKIEAMGHNRFRVFGNLNMHGVTQEIVMEGDYAGGPYRDPDGLMRSGFSAAGTLNRLDFGLRWNVGLDTGGLLVGEAVSLQIDLELVVEAGPAAP